MRSQYNNQLERGDMEEYFTADNTTGYGEDELRELNEQVNLLIINPEDSEEAQTVCEQVQNKYDSEA